MRNTMSMLPSRVLLLHITFVVLVIQLCHGWSDASHHHKKINIEAPNPSEHYPRFTELNERNYYLFWAFNKERITFEVHVRTHGWFGLGFSGNGGMNGADMVVGWISNGETHFKDLHGIGNSRPLEDQEQNYVLVKAKEENDFTVFKFHRSLNTCDDNDYQIDTETVSVIYAWNDEDPKGIDDFLYHGPTHRGAQSIMFLESQPDNRDQDNSLQFFEMVQNSVRLPASITYYHCRVFKLPKLTKKHHIVKIEPVIQKENIAVFHHFVIFQCYEKQAIDDYGYSCLAEQMIPSCRSMMFGWGSGQKTFYFPEETGISIGSPGDPTYLFLQVHYNNAKLSADISDSSGAHLYYTDQLRQYDTGSLLLGNAVVYPPMVIPPNTETFRIDTFCSRHCTGQLIPEDGIKVFAAGPHGHSFAAAIWTKHIRNGIELPELVRDDYFDSSLQHYRTLRSHIQILPGDELITTCVFNTLGEDNVVLGDLGSNGEMCLNFVLYYPRVNIQSCLSAVQDSTSMFDLVKIKAEKGEIDTYDMPLKIENTYSYLQHLNWNKETADALQNQVNQAADYIQYCERSGDDTFGITPTSRELRPEIKTPYIEKDACATRTRGH